MTWCPSDDLPPPASAAPKAGEKRYLFWRSLTSCTGKASWCSPAPENLQARPADLASDPQPGQAQNLQDFLWATLCLSLCCGKCGCPKASQACRRISAISLQYFPNSWREVFIFKRFPHAPVLKKEEKGGGGERSSLEHAWEPEPRGTRKMTRKFSLANLQGPKFIKQLGAGKNCSHG